MKEKFNSFWKNIVRYNNLFNVFEFYLLKFLGWTCILIGLYNNKGLYVYFIDLDVKKRGLGSQSEIDYFLNYELTFVFIPIIIGCLFLITKNRLKKKNE